MTGFKVGDRVVCINNTSAEGVLTLNKVYVINREFVSKNIFKDVIRIINDTGIEGCYGFTRFRLDRAYSRNNIISEILYE